MFEIFMIIIRCSVADLPKRKSLTLGHCVVSLFKQNCSDTYGVATFLRVGDVISNNH